MTKGYAVIDAKGQILVYTVSETERGAKVNWLHVDGGVSVLDVWPDEIINSLFARFRGDAMVIEVEIQLKQVLQH